MHLHIKLNTHKVTASTKDGIQTKIAGYGHVSGSNQRGVRYHAATDSNDNLVLVHYQKHRPVKKYTGKKIKVAGKVIRQTKIITPGHWVATVTLIPKGLLPFLPHGTVIKQELRHWTMGVSK